MHVAVALALALSAQAPAPPATPAPATPPPAEAPPVEKPRLLVLDLVDKGAGPEVTAAINQAVQAQAVESFVLGTTITSTQLKVALDASATQQLLGCDADACLIDVAKAAQAGIALGGNVTKVGEDVVITITAVKVADASRLGQQQRKVPLNRDLYFYAAKQLTSLVLTGRAADPRVPVVLKVDEADATIVVDGAEVAVGDGATVQLEPGQHELRVRKDGFAEWKSVVTVEEATPLSVQADLVPTRIPLWPVAVGTGALGVALAGVSIGTAIAAAQIYDGSWFGDPSQSYQEQAPVSQDQLDAKASIVTILSGGKNAEGEIGTPGIAIITAGLAVACGVAAGALLTTDLILAATSE